MQVPPGQINGDLQKIHVLSQGPPWPTPIFLHVPSHVSSPAHGLSVLHTPQSGTLVDEAVDTATARTAIRTAAGRCLTMLERSLTIVWIAVGYS
jgi:hypothetical protein